MATALSAPAAWNVWDALGRASSPIESRPRVRPGLEAAHHTSRDGTSYVVVRNPGSDHYLKLDPREYELLALMDGSRTVKELVVAYYQRNGVLALPRIAALVRQLRASRCLTDESLDAFRALAHRLRGDHPSALSLVTRMARGFVHSVLTLERVDGTLDRWYRAWGWLFFTRAAVAIGALLAILGPVVIAVELVGGRYPIFLLGGSYPASLAVLLGLAAFSLAAHELGHALAVKHAGRAVHRAGLMLYYGLPATFVDTSDVWMASRRHRLLASFAGPWTGLVLGGLAAIASVVLPDGGLGALLFGWSCVFLVTTLLNLNPLLEMDGYYLLVDLLEKPMLRPRALAFVRGPLWRKLWRRERLSGEERLFAAFGLASLAWSVAALYLALRLWEGQVTPLLLGAWAAGDLASRLAALLVVFATAAVLAIAMAQLLARLVRWARAEVAARGEQARTLRHRQALEALRAVPLWADLPERRLLDMVAGLRTLDLPAGTEVVRQGEPGNRFYVIVRGCFEVLVDGRPAALLRRGDYFGERALLHDAPRAATVVALEPGRVLCLDRATFMDTLAPDLATRERLQAAVAYRAAVAEMPLFRDLSPVELDVLLARMERLAAPRGTVVMRQGEVGDRFYLVLSGRLRVERDGEQLAQLGAGDAFGEIALLLDVPRTATVEAVDDSDLLALGAEDFRDLLAAYCGRASDLERLSHLRLAAHKRLDQVVASDTSWTGEAALLPARPGPAPSHASALG